MGLNTDYENNYVYYNNKNNKIHIDDFNINHVKKNIT